MNVEHVALRPGAIGPIELRNRILKTATFEGMTPNGRVTPALVEHHAEMARRGVGMTTVAYGAVEDAGRTFERQLLVDDEAVAGLRTLADAVHAEGGAVSLQLAHCGGFSKHARPPRGPSRAWNAYGTAAGRPWIAAMDHDDMARVVRTTRDAAHRAHEAGFDAVELHLGHGYLLSQFLSPVINRRADEYGGELESRLRFPLEVTRAVVDSVGDRMAVLAKINLDDGVDGGLDLDQAVEIAAALEHAGVHALVTSGGLVQRSAFYLMRGDVPLEAMARNDDSVLQGAALRVLGRALVRPFAWTPGFFLEPGRRVVERVELPVVALGGLDSADTLDRAAAAGFAFFAMGRTLLADPDFIARLEAGQRPTSRCDHCNLCVAQMDRGVRCVRFDGA